MDSLKWARLINPPNPTHMSHHIALLRYTAQGLAQIKDSTKRAAHFNELAEKAGVRIEGQYWTFGAYDGVLIIGAEDPKKAAQMLLALTAAGNVRTETLEAFTAKEFAAITG